MQLVQHQCGRIGRKGVWDSGLDAECQEQRLSRSLSPAWSLVSLALCVSFPLSSHNFLCGAARVASCVETAGLALPPLHSPQEVEEEKSVLARKPRGGKGPWSLSSGPPGVVLVVNAEKH